jgi:hypothetical protein
MKKNLKRSIIHTNSVMLHIFRIPYGMNSQTLIEIKNCINVEINKTNKCIGNEIHAKPVLGFLNN